jgi:hypothetical protein
MKSAKEILQSVKALFNAPVIAPVVAPAPAAAAAPAPVAAPAAKSYKTKEGADISIAQAGEQPAVGDAVSINGAPAAEGVLTLEDGTTISVDATGKISAITPPAPVTNDMTTGAAPAQVAPAVIAPVAAAAVPKTPEELKTLTESFANGTPEERIANLEVVAKALMEYSFGWQIEEAKRKASVDSAIEIYKTDLKNTQAAMAKQDQVIAGLFEFCEKIAEAPTADPKTLTGNKKDKFERTADKREQTIEKFAAGIRKLKEENSK